MARPPHPNPTPPTARPEAASEPDLSSAEVNGRAGSSASSSMQLPPPPKPGPSAPQAEAEMAGAEGSAVPSPSVGASSARDPPNTSGASSGNTVTEEAAGSPVDRQRPPYAIPEWSAAPSHPFFLEVLKDGTIIDQLDVSTKGAYMFGRSDLCDSVLLHQSISRFHAVLQFRNDGKIFLYDLGSTHGSFINKSLIKKKLYTEIHVGDVIQFGQSSRLYIFRGTSELMPPIANTKKEIDATRVNDISQGGLTQGQQTQIARNEQRISQIMESDNSDSIRESTGSRSGKAKHGSHKANQIEEEDILSSSQLEHVQTQTKGRKFLTPQSKSLSNDTKRNAFSVGTKRSNISMDYEKTVKCKRALSYDSSSSSDSEVTMSEYATYELTQRVKVPLMPNKVKIGKEAVKLVLLNAFGSIVDLHFEGFTLKGSFGLKHFLISPRTKKVTLRGLEPKQYSKGDGVLDKSQFVRMVKEMFGDDLPDDIKGWLHCIENGGNDSVLKRHINMQHSDAVFGEFCIMYHAMLELKKLDERKFKRLLSRLEIYDDWETEKFSWCVLEDNRRYQDPNHYDTGARVRDSAFGLMQQLRNCWEHPAKLYKKYLLAVVLCDHPSFLSDVQEALYDAGCLPHLDIKNMD